MPWWVLKRRIHSSWMIAVFCLGLVLGVCFSRYFNLFSNVVYSIISLVCLVIAVYKRRGFLVLFAVIGGLLFGLWCGSLMINETQKIEQFFGQDIKVSGMISDDSDIDSSGKLTVVIMTDEINNQKISAKFRTTMYGGHNFEVNDKILLSGVLTKGFGVYDGVMYNAEFEGLISKGSKSWLIGFRDEFSKSIEETLGETNGKLGIGFLLGQRKDLSSNLILALQATGLTHIIVASGYNLTILVRVARRIFEKVSKYLSMISSMLMIIGFILITGLSPSMSRAGFVATASLAAWYYGRKFHPVVLLSLAMAVTLIYNPEYAWGDIGWQLSFAAFAGVMILAPLLGRYFFGDTKLGFISQVLIETVSAQITTLPIILLAFGRFSNLAVFANLLVLPTIPFIMLATFVAGLAGLILPTFAGAIGLPAKWLLDYVIWVVEKFADVSWAVSDVRMSIVGALIYYLSLILACVYLIRKTKYKLRDSNLVE